jgi:hypothetical protein
MDAERPGNAFPRRAWERGKPEVSGRRSGVRKDRIPASSIQYRDWIAGFFNHQSKIINPMKFHMSVASGWQKGQSDQTETF